MLYKEDKEYMEHVGQLIAQPRVQKLKTITHHIYSNRLEHSIHVSYTSYKIAKKLGWDAKSTARGGLLHDMFYYDWRETKFNKSHAWVHPRLAVRNARKVTNLNKVEEDIRIAQRGGADLLARMHADHGHAVAARRCRASGRRFRPRSPRRSRTSRPRWFR